MLILRRFGGGRWALAAVLLGAGWLVSAASGYVYWSTCSFGTIGRANLDGSGVREAFIKDISAAGVALNSEYIYWANRGSPTGSSNGSIGRAKVNGKGVNNNLVVPHSVVSFPDAVNTTSWGVQGWLAFDSAHVYWTEKYLAEVCCGGDRGDYYISGGVIARANLDGTGGGVIRL